MGLKNWEMWICGYILLCVGACTYPGATAQRTEVIRDSIWKMDSLAAYQMLISYRQQVDSVKAHRDSLIQAYNDSVRTIRTPPPPVYRRPRRPQVAPPPTPSPRKTDTLQISPINIPQ